MTTQTQTPAPLALDRTVSEFYAPELRDREHTSFVVSSATLVFEDPEVLVDYLTLHKGLTPERAALVIGRRCEFQIEEGVGMRSTVYKVRAA